MIILKTCFSNKDKNQHLLNPVPYSPPPPGEGSFLNPIGKEYQTVEMGRNIMAVGKNITWKKGKGKQNHFPCNIEAIEKNIKLGKGEISWEKIMT